MIRSVFVALLATNLVDGAFAQNGTPFLVLDRDCFSTQVAACTAKPLENYQEIWFGIGANITARTYGDPGVCIAKVINSGQCVHHVHRAQDIDARVARQLADYEKRARLRELRLCNLLASKKEECPHLIAAEDK